MEMEFFCHPAEADEWYEYWRDKRLVVRRASGSRENTCGSASTAKDELAHYAQAARATSSTASRSAGRRTRGHRQPHATSTSRQHVEATRGDEPRAPRRRHGRAVHPARHRAVGRRRSGVLAFLCEAYDEESCAARPARAALPPAPRAHQGGRLPAGARRMPTWSPSDAELATSSGAVGFASTTKAADRPPLPPAGRGRHALRITVDGQTLEDQTVTVRDRDTHGRSGCRSQASGTGSRTRSSGPGRHRRGTTSRGGAAARRERRGPADARRPHSPARGRRPASSCSRATPQLRTPASRPTFPAQGDRQERTLPAEGCTPARHPLLSGAQTVPINPPTRVCEQGTLNVGLFTAAG